MEFVWLLVGGVVGGVVSYALTQRKVGDLRAAQSRAETEASTSSQAKKDLQTQLSNKNERLERYIADYSHAKTRCEGLEKKIPEEKEHLREIFEGHIKRFSQDITEKTRKQLSEESVHSIKNVLDPFKNQLEALQKAGVDTAARHGALGEQIEALQEQSLTFSKNAEALTLALQGSTKAQGDFGELILKNLLEGSGLQKGEDYLFQESIRTDDNRLQRPDVIVKMPDRRAVIIDSKMSLQSYKDYTEAVKVNNQGDAEQALKAYLTSVNNHIKDLSDKAYPKLNLKEQREGLEFVLMFMPIEAAFLLALEKDRELFNKAMGSGVVLVSPTNLLAILRVVHHMWQQSAQQKNVQEIISVAELMYEQLRKFLKSMENVGGSLRQAQEAYSDAHKRLSSDRKNYIPELAGRIKNLGLNIPKEKELPSDYLISDTEEASKAIDDTSSTSLPPEEEQSSEIEKEEEPTQLF